MAKTANIHVRMDEQIKNDAVAVLDNLGISVAEAITMYFRQVALKNGIPFELTADPVFRKNIDRVSKLKTDDLKAVLAVVPESVDELWVFGSAVTEHCRPDSDLDVCVIGDNMPRGKPAGLRKCLRLWRCISVTSGCSRAERFSSAHRI